MTEWYGNSPAQWIGAVVMTVIVLAALCYIKRSGLNRLRHFTERLRGKRLRLLLETLQKTRWPIVIVTSLYVGSHMVILPVNVEKFIYVAFIITLWLQTGLWLNHYLTKWAEDYRESQIKKNPAAVTAIGALRVIFQMVLWAFVLLLILDNLGFNIMTLLAGLGIGGVAIALAVQNILGDLFASLSIVIDRTFVIGDFLTVGDLSGTVEYIGLKNTRFRSISGEQIILSNTDLLNSRIRNYGRMLERRAQGKFSISYQTDRRKIEKIYSIIRGVIQSQEKTRFDFAHVVSFGESGLNVEYAYYILSREYSIYIQTNEKIIVQILEKFDKEGIDFAYPTRIVRNIEETKEKKYGT